MNAVLCHHCMLPVSASGQTREVDGENHPFCCYGCCLAFQMGRGHSDEAEATWLLMRLGIGAFLAMNIMLFSVLLYAGTFGPTDGHFVRLLHILLWILATPVVVILGGPFMVAAWKAARRGRTTSDTLISLGAFSAYGYSAVAVVTGSGSVYFDTATMVLVLFTLGRYLEAMGRSRAVRSLAPMLAAERAYATVVKNDTEVNTPVSDIGPGTLVRVQPGERLPVDGVVVSGQSHCDEAVLTGESQPHKKSVGATVLAGSINGTGQLLLRTTAAGAATQWGQVGRLVRQALARTGPLDRLMDRISAVFVPGVILLAAAVIVLGSQRGEFEAALLSGLAVLVVACPCALALAIPLATSLGVGQAAGRGIVIRDGAVLQRLAKVRTFAFDKTGTVTVDSPQLLAVCCAGSDETAVLATAAALARCSSHPLARGITAAAGKSGFRPADVDTCEAHPGAGITGTIDGESSAMGSAQLMTDLGWPIPSDLNHASAMTTAAIVYVGWSGRVFGVIHLAERPRPEARAVLASLRQLGMATVFVSGDRSNAVAQIASALDVSEWHAGLSPSEKVIRLKTISESNGPVAMVGDGLNDGPVLAGAAVGIAIGGATDLARETANVVLPPDGLKQLPWLLGLARDVRRIIISNLAWVFSYNLVALSLAAMGLLQPVIAAGLMAGSSVIVVFNSLRLGGTSSHPQGIDQIAPSSNASSRHQSGSPV